ncbi:MAG: hypothetical protein JNM94_01260 [Phycisphaerae bacterium]|nr:hypothetical protein [Phycisphaerae bacterium]
MSLTALVTASLLVAPPPQPPMPDEIRAAIADSIPKLLATQESYREKGDSAPDGEAAAVLAEWPYQGVYRVGGRIPYGYRVGGTSIVAQALLESEGYADDAKRRDAVARACAFVTSAIDEPLMSPDPAVYKGGYDVRGWGHCYGLRFLVALERAKAIPAGQEAAVAKAIAFYLSALQATEIPRVGGWAYARNPGIENPCASSPFMTAPTVLALLEAERAGHAIDRAVLDRAVAALEAARTESGFVDYATTGRSRDRPDQIPGAIGRMVATETALFQCGRSNVDRIAFALDRFIEHWGALEARRQKNGTHEPPYNVAPYYFFYGFHHALAAADLLPAARRDAYRAKVVAILFTVRDANGTWNDRVFPRSANFGTAMTISALAAPWRAPSVERPRPRDA